MGDDTLEVWDLRKALRPCKRLQLPSYAHSAQAMALHPDGSGLVAILCAEGLLCGDALGDRGFDIWEPWQSPSALLKWFGDSESLVTCGTVERPHDATEATRPLTGWALRTEPEMPTMMPHMTKFQV